MKRILSFTLMIVLVLGLLSACGDNQVQESSGTANQSLNSESSSGTANQSPNSESGSANPDLSLVWRIACEKDNVEVQYERNEYGLYTARNILDSNGNQVPDHTKITETYDDNSSLIKIEYPLYSYYFTYDESGKMSEILVQNDDNENLTHLTYTSEGGFCLIEYDEHYTDTYTKYLYDKNLHMLQSEYTKLGETYLTITYTYNSDGQKVTENHSKNGNDIPIEYSYNSDGLLVKKVKTDNLTENGKIILSSVYVDEYTYSALGNLLTHTGTEYDGLIPDRVREIYAYEEYTDEDYDEQGHCLYYYKDKSNYINYIEDVSERFEKTAYETTSTYDYAPEGWLLRKNRSDGSFTEYDKDGNVVVEQNDTYRTEYKQYAIINDSLLITFYELCGNDYI